MNLDEIRAMNPNEARKLGIDTLLEAIFEDVRIDASLPIERDEHGNAIRHAQRTKDAYGKVIEEKVIRWTYYGDGSTGEVNEIIIEDAKEQVTVKHTLDGKQPMLTKVLIAVPIKPELKPIER